MSPSPSADSIMLRPILSLTLEHGSMDSSFAATRALLPFVTSLRYTSGVLPDATAAQVSHGCRVGLRSLARRRLACAAPLH